MAGFDSIVQLCRHADEKEVAGTDLILRLRKGAQTSSLLHAIEAASWRITVTVDGVETTAPTERLPDGKLVDIAIHGMTKTNEVLVNNIGMLIKYEGGRFRYSEPASFYLLQEDYARGEAPVHAVVAQYRRVIRLTELIRQIADDVREDAAGGNCAVFLTNRKILVPLTYQQWDLDHANDDGVIDELESEISKEHHVEARRDIARRAIVRMLASVQQEERFSAFIRSVRNLKETFLADLDIYVSGFSFDKARDDFERKKLDYVMKLNSVGNDAMGKLLAIPVGQGLLASQMKSGTQAVIANKALLVGSLIFSVIALMILLSYVLAILQVRGELGSEVKMLKERSYPTFRKLEALVSALYLRINVHLWGIPAVMMVLLAVSSYLTWHAYVGVAISPAP